MKSWYQERSDTMYASGENPDDAYPKKQMNSPRKMNAPPIISSKRLFILIILPPAFESFCITL